MTDVLQTHVAQICSQQSVTLPSVTGDKFIQHLARTVPEWPVVHGTLRNGIEGINGFLEDGAVRSPTTPEAAGP